MKGELKTKRVNLLLKPATHESVRKIASINEKSFNEIVNEALSMYAAMNTKSIQRYNTFHNISEEV